MVCCEFKETLGKRINSKYKYSETLHIPKPDKELQACKPQLSKNSDEVAALLHIIQIVATGSKVNVKHCLGNYVCCLVPIAFFENDMTMRLSGSKLNLIKVLKDETDITCN